MQFLTKIFKALLSSRVIALLGFLGTILGAISDPQWGTIIPHNIAAWGVTLGAPIAWLGRQLVDVNGNGIPDILDAFLSRLGEKGQAVFKLLLLMALAGALLLLLQLTVTRRPVAPIVAESVVGLTPPPPGSARWVATPTGGRPVDVELLPAMEHVGRRPPVLLRLGV